MCREMDPEQEYRIDLGDLKGQMVKRIGADRSKRYFYYLNRLLSKKLSKSDFDKLCYRVIGRENLPLHNQFIRSILKNACIAKAPPPMHEPKLLATGGKSSSPSEDGREPFGSIVQTQAQVPPIWSNGVVLPTSPRKGRSAVRDRKLKDRPTLLGPNGKLDSAYHESRTMEDSGSIINMENGELTPCDYQRPLQNVPGLGLAEQPENEREASIQHHAERQRMKKSSVAPTSLPIHDHIGVAIFEDGEEVDQNHLNVSRTPLVAPLGIPLCPASIGGACRTMPTASSRNFVSYFDIGGLYDTDTLKKLMEQIAIAQGLGGVSTECANVLNNMVDVYLKKLIKSCVELVESRSEHGPRRHQIAKKQNIQAKPKNGLWPTNHHNRQGCSEPVEILQEQRASHSVSMLDFKIAMELNPQQLGEDWPLLLEKICMRGFTE